MNRDIDPAMRQALVASLKTIIFQVLAETRPLPEETVQPRDTHFAAGGAVALLAIAIEQVWGHRPAVAGVGVTLGQLLIQYRDQIPHALNSLSEDLGADLITKPKAEQLQKLQGFADAIASLEVNDETDAMLRAMIERARDHSEARPGGFTSPTPLNDTFRRGQEEPKQAALPPAPWPVGKDNAKREGWKAYFEGRSREKSPFPHARPDLLVGYREGWDAADMHDHAYLFSAEVPGHEAPEGGEA